MDAGGVPDDINYPPSIPDLALAGGDVAAAPVTPDVGPINAPAALGASLAPPPGAAPPNAVAAPIATPPLAPMTAGVGTATVPPGAAGKVSSLSPTQPDSGTSGRNLTLAPVDLFGRAISANEGTAAPGGYGIVGPVDQKTGDMPYGKYQVMGANIPQWTQRYFGQTLTPQQFLQNPAAQDAVFNGEFGRLNAKYGPQGASRAWFAGEGNMNNLSAKDSLGTTVAQYQQNFNRNLGLPAQPNQAPGAGGMNAMTPASAAGVTPYQGTPVIPSGRISLLDQIWGLTGNEPLSPSAKQGIMAAGFGMMASPS